MVSRRRWQWARYMTMKVATRSSGTLGGRQRSRKLGNSGNRVAITTLLEAHDVGGIYLHQFQPIYQGEMTSSTTLQQHSYLFQMVFTHIFRPAGQKSMWMLNLNFQSLNQVEFFSFERNSFRLKKCHYFTSKSASFRWVSSSSRWKTNLLKGNDIGEHPRCAAGWTTWLPLPRQRTHACSQLNFDPAPFPRPHLTLSPR